MDFEIRDGEGGSLGARGTAHISFSDKREKPESVRRGMWYEKYE